MSPQVKNQAKIILLPLDGDTGHLYGMNTKNGSVVPFAFQRATQGTYIDESGKMNTMESGKGRIDYGYYSDERKILIETESTNLVKTPATLESVIVSNYSDSFYSGFKVTASNTLSAHRVVYNNGVDAIEPQSAYILLKYNGVRYTQLRIRSGTVQQWIMVDLVNGVITQNTGNLTANISKVKNDWYRVSLQDVGLAGATSYFIIGLSDQPTVSTQTYQFTGNGVDGIYYAYPQVEKRASSTSYIPISSSAVTRSADLLNITLDKSSNIEISTSNRLIELNKIAGLWNINEDLNNEGINYLAIY